MKIEFTAIGTLLAAGSIFASCSESSTVQNEPIAEPAIISEGSQLGRAPHTLKVEKEAIAAIRSEPQVIDVVYNPNAVVNWTVGVRSDGTSRVGFAEYLCMILDDFPSSDRTHQVRIVDYAAFMTNFGDGRAASLGQVDCATGSKMSV